MESILVSICIPAYSMKGRGDFFLNRCLTSIFLQNYSNKEIIISNHGSYKPLDNVVSYWNKYLNIKYIYFNEKIGSISANANNCVDNASGIIDFLFQDDYYYNPISLSNRVNNLTSSNKMWSLSSTIHQFHDNSFGKYLKPRYNKKIHLGLNTIGAPSLLTYYKDCYVKFDERLNMLMDCDFYKSMRIKYGKPKVSPKITVVSSVWDGQSQNSISKEIIEIEKEITKFKYS